MLCVGEVRMLYIHFCIYMGALALGQAVGLAVSVLLPDGGVL